jgi:hypothetical protein
MPAPKSKAAAGKRMSGPPLGERVPTAVVSGAITVVAPVCSCPPCASTLDAKSSETTTEANNTETLLFMGTLLSSVG